MARPKGEVKVQLSVGVAESIRKQLEAAARVNDRSLSGEVVARLKKSLAAEPAPAA
jgi:hypothetical protein